MYPYPEYYNITYNYPTLYTNRYIENRLGNQRSNGSGNQRSKGTSNQRFLTNKLTRDGIYLIFDNRKKPTIGVNYAEDLVRDYAKSYAWRTAIKNTTKFLGKSAGNKIRLVKAPGDFSTCVIAEVNNLKDLNIFNKTNLGLVHDKCTISTAYNLVKPELGLIDTIAGSSITTLADIYLESQYIKETNYNWFGDKMNKLSLVLYDYVEEPVLDILTNITKPINNGVDFAIDNLINIGENYFDKILNNFSNQSDKDNYFIEGLDYNADVDNQDNTGFNFDETCNDLSYEDQVGNYIDGLVLNQDLQIEENYNEISDTDLDQKTNTVLDKDQNTGKFNLDNITTKLDNISKFVNVCNLIKNFDNMTDLDKIYQIQSVLLSLVNDNKIISGGFKFIYDLANRGKIEIESVLNLAVNVAEKYLSIPLTNAFNFIDNLIKGKSVREYLMPLVIDISSLLVPGLNIINIMSNIIKGIESLFSSYKSKDINGISMFCSDELKIGFFKKSHKVTYENQFFGIKVTYKTKHSSDAKRLCEAEVTKQLDHKVYQVIGIPIEFINDTIKKPNTRYENYTMKYYLDDLKMEWLNVNDPYLSEQEKKIIKQMYFENNIDKEYRYELAKKGESPSWFYENKKHSIIKFIKDIWKILDKKIKSKIDLRKLSFTSLHDLKQIFNGIIDSIKETISDIFDNKKIKQDNNLGETEQGKQNESFEKARDKRKRGDNRRLDDYRDKQRNKYNNQSDDYSRKKIIKRACRELYQRQQSAEYFFESVYSSFIGSTGLFLANIDNEIRNLVKNPITYPFKKMYEFSQLVLQGHVSRICVDQATLYFSLLEYSERFTDDALINYINPFISSGIGLSIGILRHLSKFKKEEGDTFKGVLFNGAVSTVNSSFNAIYTYSKTVLKITSLKTTAMTKFIAFLTKTINCLFKIGLTIEFVTAVSVAMLFNLGVRLGSKLYAMYKQKKYCPPKRIEHDVWRNPIKADLFKNPIRQFRQIRVTPNIYKRSIRSDISNNKVKKDICCNFIKPNITC